MLRAANADVASRDSRLQGMGTLLDPDAFAASYAEFEQLNTVPHVATRYLSYKPGRRCVALYDVTIAGGDAFPIVATALTTDGWDKHCRTSDNLQVRSQSVTTSSLTKQLIHVQRFPDDRQLRSIAKIYNPEKRPRILKRVLGPHLEYADVDLLTLAYKPARRYVACLQIGGRARCALKFYCGSSFESATQRARALAHAQAVRAPTLLATNKQYGIIATEWLSGNLLADVMQRDDYAAEAMAEVGSSLAGLHAIQGVSHLANGSQCEPHRLLDVARDIDFLCPELDAASVKLAKKIAQTLERSALDFVVLHGDFYAKQVIIDSTEVRFIDFDRAMIGDRYIDIGNFLAQLHWSTVLGDISESKRLRCTEEFLRGYQEKAPQIDDQRLSVQTAASLLRCAIHAFRRALPDWPKRIHQMLHIAAQSLPTRPNGSAFMNLNETDRTNGLHNVEHRHSSIPKSSCQTNLPLDPWLDVPSLDKLFHVYCPGIEQEFGKYTVTAARLCRLKPNRRCLIEYELTQTNSQTQDRRSSILGKTRFKGLDWATPLLHRQLWQAGFNNSSDVRVPKFLGSVPPLNMWLQELVTGSRVACDQSKLTELQDRIARALDALHHSAVLPVPHHTLVNEVRNLDVRFAVLLQEFPHWSHRILSARKQCHRIASKISTSPVTTIHRDFYFDQVLVADSYVCLLDLDLVSRGSRELDVGNYIGHFYEYAVRCPQHAHHCLEAARRFCNSYLAACPNVCHRDINHWTMLTLARHISLSTQLPNRSQTTEVLFEQLAKHSRSAAIALWTEV